MSSCPACNGVEGARHTCPGSGTFRAAEAHVAGAVEEIAEAWPRFQVTLHLYMREPDEQTARGRLTHLVSELLADDVIERADFAIEEQT